MLAMMFLILFAPPAGSEGGAGSLIGSLLPIVLIFVVFYFFMIRPQQKKQKEREKMLDSVTKGDKVVTISGAHGVVESVEEGNTVVIRLIPANISVKFDKSSVSSITRPTGTTDSK